MTNVSLFHLTRINIKSIKKFFNYVNYCLPAQLDEVHILNTVRFFDRVMPLIKPFIREGGLEKVNINDNRVIFFEWNQVFLLLDNSS